MSDKWDGNERRKNGRIDREHIEATVATVLTMSGMDVENPHEMQADFGWVRKSRKGAEAIATWIMRATVTVVVSGLLYAAWRALRGQ